MLLSALFLLSTAFAFITDDYPITEDMLRQTQRSIEYKNWGSYDRAWFANDKHKQALIIDIYTDYYKGQIIHCYTDNIPNLVYTSLELHGKKEDNELEYDLLDDKFKPEAVNHFLKYAQRISSQYFKTHKGYSLGMSSKKAVRLYGKPTGIQETRDGKLFTWDYVGDFMGDIRKSELPKDYAVDSFGYHVKVLFKNDKAVVIIMGNDNP